MNSPFTSLKEAALQSALKAFINQEIGEYGVVTECAVDTSRKTIRVEAELKGESSPIVIIVNEYELTERDGRVHVSLLNFSASREWITAVLNKYVASRTFQLPDAAKLLL